jgi:hypothetical protein
MCEYICIIHDSVRVADCASLTAVVEHAMFMYSLLLVIAACEVEVHILPLEVYSPSKLRMIPADQLANS